MDYVSRLFQIVGLDIENSNFDTQLMLGVELLEAHYWKRLMWW